MTAGASLREELIAKGLVRPGNELSVGSKVTSARVETAKRRAPSAPQTPAPAPAAPEPTLAAVLDELGQGELKVIAYLARRLLEGQRTYGRIDLVSDPRDFARERCAEIGDLLVYSAFQVLRRELAE